MQDTNSRSISSKDEVKSLASSSGRSARVMRKSFKGSIGFIGLGHMGSAMATNLAGGGFGVIGDEPASANLVKLAGNAMTATTLEALAEVLALLRKRGVAPEKFL